uniref:Uncharacterized protein n=1 Tax=Cyclopterus lumpus TaxID=8103 RepID=A0A8C2ZHZ9_CYCLU
MPQFTLTLYNHVRSALALLHKQQCIRFLLIMIRCFSPPPATVMVRASSMRHKQQGQDFQLLLMHFSFLPVNTTTIAGSLDLTSDSWFCWKSSSDFLKM